MSARLFAVGLALALGTTPAYAQADLGAPIAPLGAGTVSDAGLPAAPAQAPGIEMGALRQLDVWTVGALTREAGAMPESLWTGSDSAVLGPLFDRLPAVIDSPAARALARRALASAADPPAGAAVAEAGRKRFSALARIGFADDVSVMGVGATSALGDPNVAQFAAQAELARARIEEACRRVQTATSGSPPPFVLRLRAYCAAVVGEPVAAELALEVARSANAEDSWFRSAVAALAARPARPPAARYDNSLNTSISLAANLPASANPLANSSTLALLTVARGETATAGLRAQAAALAFRRGALSAAETRTLLKAAATPTSTGLVAAVRDVEAQPGSLAAAIAIAGVLNQSSGYGDFAALSALFHDDIAALTQAPDAASTLTFARAAAAAGDMALAGRLAAFAAQAGAAAPLVARVRAAVGAEDPGALAQRIAAGGPSTARDVAIMALLNEPDADVRAYLLANPPQGGARPDAGLAASLAATSTSRALGETAILASLIAAPGAHTLDAGALGDVVRALKAVGLDDEAKAFVVEALLGPTP